MIDGSRDRVLLIGRVLARGKGSGAPVHQPIFTAVTVRNGKVARIDDHTERAQAIEASGLAEVGDVGGERRDRAADNPCGI